MASTAAAAGSAAPTTGGGVGGHTFSLQQAMLRVKDPRASVDFYTRHFSMTVIDIKRFPEHKFDLYFLASIPPADKASLPEPGTKEASSLLWTFPRTVLELTHNYGTEDDPAFSYASGNAEPYRGFGHTGFIVDDVAAFCAGLEAAGVRFQKRLSDGRMRHIAFALDPDGYWVEILPRTTEAGKLAAAPPQPAGWPTLTGQHPSLQQVMYRIRDPAASLPFYTRLLGMALVCERHFDDFSLFFVGTPPPGTALPADPKSDAAWDWIAGSSGSFLELTHNHGTETDPAFKGYHNGNTEPGRGFEHVGFLTPRLEDACAALEAAGVGFAKRPHEGRMRGLAFARDPDGYLIEIIQHGVVM